MDLAANHVNERRAPIIFLRLSARGPLLLVRDNAARNVANIPNTRRARTHTLASTTTTTGSILVQSRTRKRVRGGGQRSWKPWYLISGDRLKFSFPRAISLRHSRDVYFEFTFDSMNYCNRRNCRPLTTPP